MIFFVFCRGYMAPEVFAGCITFTSDIYSLGITDPHTQNSRLLQKFIAKLITPSMAPWHRWLRSNYGWNGRSDFGDHHRSHTAVWRGILEGL